MLNVNLADSLLTFNKMKAMKTKLKKPQPPPARVFPINPKKSKFFAFSL